MPRLNKIRIRDRVPDPYKIVVRKVSILNERRYNQRIENLLNDIVFRTTQLDLNECYQHPHMLKHPLYCSIVNLYTLLLNTKNCKVHTIERTGLIRADFSTFRKEVVKNKYALSIYKQHDILN